MGGLLHLVQQGGDWAGPQPAQSVPNVTAHPSTASVPITVLPYNGPLLCGFNVPLKGYTFVTFTKLTQQLYLPLANVGALRDDAVHLFVCLSVCLLPETRTQKRDYLKN